MHLSAQRTWRQLACFVAAVALTFSAGIGHAQSAEYQHKAAVIMGIVRATEWPVSKLKSDSPIVIGVFGPEIAADKIRESVAGRAVKGRNVVVKLLSAAQEIEGCHVIFVSGLDDASLRSVLRRTSGDPILTFGDSPAFADKGGIFILQSSGGADGTSMLRTLLDGRNLRRAKLKIDDEALMSARVEPVSKR